jgi:hypothetical protein
MLKQEPVELEAVMRKFNLKDSKHPLIPCLKNRAGPIILGALSKVLNWALKKIYLLKLFILIPFDGYHPPYNNVFHIFIFSIHIQKLSYYTMLVLDIGSYPIVARPTDFLLNKTK